MTLNEFIASIPGTVVSKQKSGTVWVIVYKPSGGGQLMMTAFDTSTGGATAVPGEQGGNGEQGGAEGGEQGANGKGGDGSGAGGGGGGSSDKMTWKEFQKMAKLVYYQLGIKYNESIAKAAFNYKKAKIENSGDFLTYIRRYDKTYVNSQNYKERAKSLWEVYKKYNPNTKKTLKDMQKLVAKGVTASVLDYRIQHSDWYTKKAYKYIKYNPDLSPEQYRATVFDIKDILSRTYGRGPDQNKPIDFDMRAIFKRHMTADEVRARVNAAIVGGTAMQWQDRSNKEAGWNRQEQRQFISRGPTAGKLENQLTTAQRSMASYIKSQQAVVSTDREEETKKLVKKI